MTQAGPCLVRFALRFADTHYNQYSQTEHERASHIPSPLRPILVPLTASRKTTAVMDVTNSTLPEDPHMPLQANVALSTALGINLLLSF